MYTWPSSQRNQLILGFIAAASLIFALEAAAQPLLNTAPKYSGVGRGATAKEIAAWDIDVRPDFKGLPKGSGSVAKGMEVWESKCESCHGVFGENNQIFTPLIGGTSKEDMKTGRVEKLTDASFPGRTTIMKLSSVSTLWDYINRAMPWNQPKSLSTEEVYSVTAYMLNMGGVLPDNFVLSDQNINQVQQMLPNRNGMTTAHAMWPGAGARNSKPDVKQLACMKNCASQAVVSSFLPDFAKDAHGNLADQNRLVGPQRGMVTTNTAAPKPSRPTTVDVAAGGPSLSGLVLAQNNGCTACHGLENKILGPSFIDIAKKYVGRSDAPSYLAAKVKNGSAGVWGAVPMPGQALSQSDAVAIAEWISSGASK